MRKVVVRGLLPVRSLDKAQQLADQIETALIQEQQRLVSRWNEEEYVDERAYRADIHVTSMWPAEDGAVVAYEGTIKILSGSVRD